MSSVEFLFVLDIYVKVCLLVQNKVVKTKKTEVAKRSASPVFNESFTFKLPINNLDMASVTITAMQHMTGTRGYNPSLSSLLRVISSFIIHSWDPTVVICYHIPHHTALH